MMTDLQVLAAALAQALHSASTHARPLRYLDPGSGSYLLQLLIAGALGALFALRLYWKRVKGFILRLMGRGVDEEED